MYKWALKNRAYGDLKKQNTIKRVNVIRKLTIE